MFNASPLRALCIASILPLCACSAEQTPRVRSTRAGPTSAAGSGGSTAKSNVASGLPSGPLLQKPTGLSANGGLAQKVCASAVVQASKTPPIVMFVIDGSGSMCAPYGSGTRWQALRSALLDPSMGLINRLQANVKFGALLYDGTIDGALTFGGNPLSAAQNPPCAFLAAMNKAEGMCPQLLETQAALNNAMAIDRIYPMVELGGSTPTDRAMNHAIDTLIPMLGAMGPDDPKASEIYVILATDGAPNDICVGGVGGDGAAQRQGVIAAVQRGAEAGITTWVISLAGGDTALEAHLNEVAKAGSPMDPMAHPFSPNDPAELIKTLARLLGGAVGCNIVLNGKVTVGQECLGTVQQNGVPIPCCQTDAAGAWSCANAQTSAPNGWRLTDPSSIELVGDACIQFLLGPAQLINAEFPCEIFSPN